MRVILARTEEEGKRWEQFVQDHPGCTAYHQWGWKNVIEKAFGWPTYYWMAEDDQGRIRGVLPVVWQKSWLFGSFLTSLPFVNYAGVAGDTTEVEQALVREAVALAGKRRVRHLELRHRSEHALGSGLVRRSHRVAVVRPVERDTEHMWRTLPPKVRTDIRKAMKSDLVTEVGGEDFLDDFYNVFSRNMRDLGTPVYSRRFFAEIFRAFPTRTFICVVRHQDRAVAASLLYGFRDSLEVPWSSSLREYLSFQPNMLLYWKNICHAGEQGFRWFDFGRSPVGSGTLRFKMQWGSEELPLCWDYWFPAGTATPELNPQNPKYSLAIRLWQKLPLAVANRLGPRIVRCLP